MNIEKIHLAQFRNFTDRVFSFSPNITVLVGHNASGKTNILESIFLLATGKSFKAKVEEEMINYKNEIARVQGKVIGDDIQSNLLESEAKKDGGVKLEIVLTRGFLSAGSTKTQKVPRKKLLVDGVSKRLVDFSGNLKVVLFGPQDLDLVTESPSIRRTFLDTLLSQVNREYRRASLSYMKGLRQRNRLLVKIREENAPRTQLLFWDKLLIKNGNYISEQREKFLEFANSHPDLKDHNFSLEYDKSAISEARLAQYKTEEVYAGTTLVGPHRDDFVFKIANSNNSNDYRDLSRFGSRGEQRMGVMWLKLIELLFIEEETEEKPVLLLDDIFSELDHEHRQIVVDVSSNQQTIITTADPHYVENLSKVQKIAIG